MGVAFVSAAARVERCSCRCALLLVSVGGSAGEVVAQACLWQCWGHGDFYLKASCVPSAVLWPQPRFCLLASILPVQDASGLFLAFSFALCSAHLKLARQAVSITPLFSQQALRGTAKKGSARGADQLSSGQTQSLGSPGADGRHGSDRSGRATRKRRRGQKLARKWRRGRCSQTKRNNTPRDGLHVVSTFVCVRRRDALRGGCPRRRCPCWKMPTQICGILRSGGYRASPSPLWGSHK